MSTASDGFSVSELIHDLASDILVSDVNMPGMSGFELLSALHRTHARFLEMTIQDIRVVNSYLPNGDPVGTEKFAYKLAWMERLGKEMSVWLKTDMPVLIGGDFNVIPEDVDCHKPASWIHDALFQPERRAQYRAFLKLGYIDAF